MILSMEDKIPDWSMEDKIPDWRRLWKMTLLMDDKLEGLVTVTLSLEE